MQKGLFLWMYFLLIVFTTNAMAAQGFEDKTCPAYVQVLQIAEINGANAQDIAWVTQALGDTIPILLKKQNIRVTTPQSLRAAIDDIGKKQTSGQNNDSQNIANSLRGDFVVIVKWQKIIDNKFVLRLKLLDKNSNELASRAMDIQDPKIQVNQIDQFVRKSGRDFGRMLINRFYCIEISPKEASVAANQKQNFQVKVENLKGEAISNETVEFDVASSSYGMVSPGSQALQSGSANTTYEQKKTGENKVKASIAPSTPFSTATQAIAKISSGNMLLILKSEETAEAHEDGASATAKTTRTAEIKLTIDPDTKLITGQGEAKKVPWVNSLRAQGYGGHEWGHSAPNESRESVEVKGLLIENDKTLHLKIKITPIDKTAPAAITVVVEGESFTYRGPANLGEAESVDVNIPYEAGATKEVPIDRRFPGVHSYGKYEFKLAPLK